MIKLRKIEQPKIEDNLTPVTLTDETMALRKNKVLRLMKENNYDSIIIYADLEHGSNFEYLSGFVPRFEEALLVLHSNEEAYMVLGNENLNKADKSRIKVTGVHMPHLSLPNQPMIEKKSVTDILKTCDLEGRNKIGLIGWKNFTSSVEDNSALFDLPYFLVKALMEVCPDAEFRNAAHIMIGDNGARTTNNANEFAHYEFGAALAGNAILEAMNEMDEGISEFQVAEKLARSGQRHTVVTIMASGERFVKANIYPTHKPINLGDRISMTTAFKGGLQSRGGYAVRCTEELPVDEQSYLDRVAIPYYNAIKVWLESIHIGQEGGILYDTIEKVLPQEQYGWDLNPGHLCSDEEWMSTPVYKDSTETIKSGMLFQIDFIPSVPGFGGTSCESGIFIADASLRDEIKRDYPEVWNRIETRREYIRKHIGLELAEELLPTSNATIYYRPYLLNKEEALTYE